MAILHIQRHNDVVVARLEQKEIVDSATIRRMGEEFKGLTTEAATTGKLLVNFEKTEQMSSRMIGPILRLYGQCRRDKIWLKLCGISPALRPVFDLGDLPEIHVDEGESLKAFEKGRRPAARSRRLKRVREASSFHVDGYMASFLCSRSASLSRDSRRALVGGSRLTWWDVTHGRCLQALEGHAGPVTAVCMSPDDRYAVSGSADTSLRLWDLTRGQCVRTFEGHSGMVTSVWLDPGGKFVLSGAEGRPKTPAETAQRIVDAALGGHSDRGEVRLWQAATGRCLRAFHSPRAHTPWTGSLCLSPDGRYAMWGTGTYKLQLWDLATGRCVRTFGSYRREFCEDDPASASSMVSAFDRSGSLVRWVLSACWSFDGRYLLTGGRPCPVVWDAATGRWRHLLNHIDGNAVCFSGDGQYAVTGGGKRAIRLWELATETCLHTFSGHEAPVRALCLSPDGQHLLSGSADGRFKLWSLEWEDECEEPADWDEGARSYLETFLTLHTPHGAELPDEVEPTSEQIADALARKGRPSWSQEDFQELLTTLRHAGYSHLRSEGVKRELEAMAAGWQGPPPYPATKP
jgi:WD40 repeat protein/anti-anti-sigma regulatory factor